MFGEVRGGSTQPQGSQKPDSFSDRKQRLQGERRSVLIYFRRTWGNDVLYHSGRLCPFELCRIVLYTLHSCVLGLLCVGSPAGSLRIYKKASLYLPEKRLSSAGRTCWLTGNLSSEQLRGSHGSFGETGVKSEL